MTARIVLHDAATRLGGEVAGGQIRCPSPGHSSDDRSLSTMLDPHAQEGFVVFSHANDDFQVCRDHVRKELSLGDRHPAQPTPGFGAASHCGPQKRSQRDDTKLDAATRDLAMRIWEEAADPADSPVSPYLASRGIGLPDGAAGQPIRWHADCPFGPGRRVGCMVALVTDIQTNEPLGIHRIALDKSGRKIDELGSKGRLSLGPIGGAVKLTPDEGVTLSVGVGEGIESTLSLRNLDGCCALSVWALLSAGQLAAFPVLSGIESLWIAADHDAAGISATRATARRWWDAGREVVIYAPRSWGQDLNDIGG